MPGTLLYNRHIVPRIDASRRQWVRDVEAVDPHKLSTRLGEFRPLHQKHGRAPAHPFRLAPDLHYFLLKLGKGDWARVPVFEVVRALFTSHSRHIRHVIEGGMDLDRPNRMRIFEMRPDTFRRENQTLYLKALVDLTGHEVFAAAMLGDEHRFNSAVQVAANLRRDSFRLRKAVARTIFPLLAATDWEVDMEPVRVAKVGSSDAEEKAYETWLITRIWEIKCDLGVREIVCECRRG